MPSWWSMRRIRSARTPAFLNIPGYELPVEERLPVHLRYASQFLRIPAAWSARNTAFSIGPIPERPIGVGVSANDTTLGS